MSLIVGNWKMNTLPDDAAMLTESLVQDKSVRSAISEGVGVVLCPPYTSLHAVTAVLRRLAGSAATIKLGAQNCSREDSGAYTGEISAPMLTALGCEYVIVGHSERRRDQFESNEIIGLKALRALSHGLTPIVCIGESLDERQTNRTIEVLREQIDGIISTAGRDTLASCVIAYEPIWAIGTGQSATAAQVQTTHEDVRLHLRSSHSLEIPVIYGGSVTPTNSKELLALSAVDGALVGGASLKADQFSAIIASAVVA